MTDHGITAFHACTTPDSDGWYHIMPMGEFPGVAHKASGAKMRITDVVDRDAVDAIMAHYDSLRAAPAWPGFLVGKEHSSQDPQGSTEAYAWVTELQARTGEDVPSGQRGIWAKLNKTPLGESVIGSVYKYFSTVNMMAHIAGDRYRPVAIDDIGLTNKPAYKTLVPAMHRDQNQQEVSTMLDTLKAILAKHKIELAQDANEDGVVTAIDTALAGIPTLTERATTAEHRVTELETVELDRAADAFVVLHKDRITDPEKVKALYKSNRQAAEDFIALIKAPEAKQPQKVLHRAGTKPDASTVDGVDETKAAQRDAYLDEVKARHNLPSRAAAWEVAAAAKPELFS